MPADMEGRETGQDRPRMPSEDPLAPSTGLMLGVAIGLAIWFAVIVLAVVIT